MIQVPQKPNCGLQRQIEIERESERDGKRKKKDMRTDTVCSF